MTCPHCNSSEIVEGQFTLKKSGMDWIVFGFGWSDLHFHPKDEKKSKLVMGSGGLRPGFRCNDCGTLALFPDKDRLRHNLDS